MWSKDYDKSALLALATQDLQHRLPSERLHGRLLGCVRPNRHVAAALHVPEDTLFGGGLEVGCVSFPKKVFSNWAQGKRQKLWQPARGQGRLPW